MKQSKIRQHIVETASNLFYENGYNSTGINEIISRAGIAKATLYNHFSSKEDICLAYLEHKNSTFLELIDAFCRSKEGGKLQILGIFEFLEQFYYQDEFNGCWCIKTVAEIPQDNTKIRTEVQQQKKLFLQTILNLLNDNLDTIKNENLERLAKKIYLLYEGAVTESHLHQMVWPIQEAKEMCRTILD